MMEKVPSPNVNVLIQWFPTAILQYTSMLLNNTKNKKQERLYYIKEEIRVCLSHIQPNIDEIKKKKYTRIHTK